MRSFHLAGLEPATFAPLFMLDEHELAARNIRRVRADADFGFPCRVSLQDAQPGDELLLLPFEHQTAVSPYRASGPIFVRQGAQRRVLAAGEVPPYVARRVISLRAYDAQHMMIAADVVEGTEVQARLHSLFADPAVGYVQLHNARRGCFSCTALPVD